MKNLNNELESEAVYGIKNFCKGINAFPIISFGLECGIVNLEVLYGLCMKISVLGNDSLWPCSYLAALWGNLLPPSSWRQ